jgi:hypothetical protein
MAGMISVGLVFTREYLDTSFRTPSEVLTELNIPVLAAVPLRGKSKTGTNGNGNGNGSYGNGNGNGNSHTEDAYSTQGMAEGPQ